MLLTDEPYSTSVVTLILHTGSYVLEHTGNNLKKSINASSCPKHRQSSRKDSFTPKCQEVVQWNYWCQQYHQYIDQLLSMPTEWLAQRAALADMERQFLESVITIRSLGAQGRSIGAPGLDMDPTLMPHSPFDF